MSHHARKLALLERLQELTGRIDGIEDALEAPHSKDWEEAAVEREDEEVLERLGKSGRAEIARISSALTRYARGEYGQCVKCGDEIASGRLDLLPDTPHCARCAAGADQTRRRGR